MTFKWKTTRTYQRSSKNRFSLWIRAVKYHCYLSAIAPSTLGQSSENKRWWSNSWRPLKKKSYKSWNRSRKNKTMKISCFQPKRRNRPQKLWRKKNNLNTNFSKSLKTKWLMRASQLVIWQASVWSNRRNLKFYDNVCFDKFTRLTILNWKIKKIFILLSMN